MPYDYQKHCPSHEIREKLAVAVVIYAGLVTALYTLASIYL